MQEIKALEWNGGYDRNGSHDAGEYRDYEGTVGEMVNETYLYPIIDYITQAMQQAREQALEEAAALANHWWPDEATGTADQLVDEILALKNKGA